MSEAKQKAVNIIVESLKLYITLSVAFIGGLITFYAKGFFTLSFLSFTSVTFFSLCAIFSVITINSFVKQVNDDNINIYKNSVKIPNFCALICFGIGLVLGFIFLFKTSTASPMASDSLQSSPGITIDGSKAYIGQDVKTRVRIITDSKGQIVEVRINE